MMYPPGLKMMKNKITPLNGGHPIQKITGGHVIGLISALLEGLKISTKGDPWTNDEKTLARYHRKRKIKNKMARLSRRRNRC